MTWIQRRWKLACKSDATKAEEHQWGFTFRFKSTPQQCIKHAESRGSVLEVKDFLLHPGPVNPINTVFKYLWFGAGSVPWKGQGKYPLGQLLFLLSGVIITRQLDILLSRVTCSVGALRQ